MLAGVGTAAVGYEATPIDDLVVSTLGIQFLPQDILGVNADSTETALETVTLGPAATDEENFLKVELKNVKFIMVLLYKHWSWLG